IAIEYIDKMETTYHNQVNTWLLGRPVNEIMTRTMIGQAMLINRIDNHYTPNWLELTKQVTEPVIPSLRRELQNTYNSFGNLTRERLFANNGTANESRDKTYTYDGNQRFVMTETNALGHVMRFTYEQRLGNILTETDPNNLTISRTYDGFGREKTVKTPGKPIVNYTYSFVNGGAKFNMLLRTSGQGTPTTDVWTDIYNREVRICTTDRKGRRACTLTDYLANGQKRRKSEPYFFSQGPSHFTTYTYDARFRKTKEVLPGPNRVRRYTNNRLQVTMTNELDQVSKTWINSLGDVVKVTDANNQTTNFEYDSRKNITKTTMPGNVVVQWLYDALGRNFYVLDPNLGPTTIRRNNFGEIIETVNAKNQKTTNTYDKLGRRIRKVQPEGTCTWVYDQGNKAIGRLSRSKSYNDFEQVNTYDGVGRIAVETYRDPSGTSYDMRYNYNSYGLLNELTYPTGFKVAHQYTTSGLLTMVKEAGGIDIYWKFEDENARNQITKETRGLRRTNYTYDVPNGRMLRIHTNNNTQDLRYHYDALGNMLVRHDVIAGVAETMTYDNLNRVVSTQITGASAIVNTYDALGNITYRSDVGCYEYGSSRAHAVTRIKNAQGGTLRSMGYDAMGSMIRNGNINMNYRTSGQVWRMTQGNKRHDFFFDADDHRQLQKNFTNGALQISKRYIGRHYELESNWNTGAQKHTHYIMADDVPVAIRTMGSEDRRRYLHLDHLGSTQTITNEVGAVEERFSYDVWGARRNPNNWSKNNIPTTTIDRGFTFHEHLDLGQFVHMNARVYDPTIGRFNSADPYIQFPENLQSYNRYTYVLNNPLLFTDPSGNFISILAGAAAIVADVAIQVAKDILTEAAIRLVFGDNPPAFLGYALQLVNYDYNNVSSYNLIAETTSGSATARLDIGIDPNVVVIDGYEYDVGVAGESPIGDFLIQGVLTFGVGIVAKLGKSAITKLTTRLSSRIAQRGSQVVSNAVTNRAASKLPDLSRKLDFVFGKATGNLHNIQRSTDMLRNLNRIGIYDNMAGRAYVRSHINQTFNTTAGVVQANGRILRESLLMGPNGALKMQTVWTGDRLTTVFLIGG
ncbi:MAG: RHS repeat-associated core domain-containing protein, partial [Bacteroidota bacterium]